jgi:hypothetical protein
VIQPCIERHGFWRREQAAPAWRIAAIAPKSARALRREMTSRPDPCPNSMVVTPEDRLGISRFRSATQTGQPQETRPSNNGPADRSAEFGSDRGKCGHAACIVVQSLLDPSATSAMHRSNVLMSVLKRETAPRSLLPL